MRALVIDDERLARKELISLLSDYPQIEIVGEAVNADDAQEKIAELKPGLLFLDIQMPGRNGFELLESLDVVPKVIFTTAYDEYALKAFEVNALDYLLKPIRKERLEECIQKVVEEDNVEKTVPITGSDSQKQEKSVSNNVKCSPDAFGRIVCLP